ncbi:MAG: serine/threonine-protein kinase [Planctomycetaceae bacterium]
MTDSSRSGQSSVEQPGLFAFSDSPPVSSGPQTIIHPDRRAASVSMPSAASTADSSIWSKLFPQAAQPVDAAAEQSVAGVELGHFVIERRIGSGGMGAVFRAIDQRLGRTVALKILGPNQTHDAASVQRFHNEARASARLDHDNIARVFYSGEDRGIHFIAYEFVVGTTVRDLIREAGRLSSADAVNYTLQIAAALRHMTAAGVVHRDIKPSNIIISDNGRAKLLDLGLARQRETESGTDLTIAGTTLGTFDYISPEQAKDPRKVDVRSDIYSLGCTLYHMLTGSAPYPEGTVLQKLLDHQDAKLPDPREKNPNISRQLAAVVQKMMASNPDERYQRPDDVMADLMIIAGSLGLRAASPEGIVWSVPRIVRPRFWERNLGWVAMGTALLLIVMLLRWYPSFEPQEKRPDNGHASTTNSTDTGPAHETGPVAGLSSDSKFALNPKDVFGPGTDGNLPPLPNDDSFSKFIEADGFGNPNRSLSKGGVAPSLPAFPQEHLTGTAPPLPPAPTDDGSPVEAPKPYPVAVATTIGEKARTQAAPPVLNPPAPLPAVALMSESGNVDSYPTLEAACRAAVDGSVIVLNYDGRRVAPPERRMKVENKRVTIRAGKRADGTSFRPQLVFDATPKTSDGDTRMFTLVGGGIKLINVDLRITVRDGVDSDQWAAFSCIGANRVRLQGSRVTFVNPSNRPAAVFELKPGSRLDKMNTMPGSSTSQNTEIEVEKSLLRGDCDLLIVKHTDPGRFKIDHSVVAIAGTLLAVTGDRDMPEQTADLELQLDHVTCLVGKGLLTMNSGEESRELLPVNVVASNNVFATRISAPFVFMTGNTNSQDFGSRLRWNGEKNVFNGFEKMWVVQPTSISAGFDEHHFDQWLRLWSSDTEVNVTNHESFWRRESSTQKPPSQLDASDFALDEEHEHPTISQGTDGETVGADLTQFEAPFAPPAPVPADQPQNGERGD